MVREGCGPTLRGTGHLTSVATILLPETVGDGREVVAKLHAGCPRRGSMIANYTDHAANERTFLAWIRTGLAVAAFGFFLVKLDVLVDTVGGGTLPRLPAADAYAFVVVAARYVGLAMVVTGVVIIARSSAGFERTRRAIE